MVIPYLTTRWSTYSVLFLLLAAHLLANYIAVRGVVLRSLNRQRTGIAWTAYRQSDNSEVPSPAHVATYERILDFPGTLCTATRDGAGRRIVGWATVGLSLSSVLSKPIPTKTLTIFDSERYILWFDPRGLGQPGDVRVRLHVFLKEGHKGVDHLKAWVHAVEAGRVWARRRERTRTALGEPRREDRALSKAECDETDEASGVICEAYQGVKEHFATFVEKMRVRGWLVEDGGINILTGSPKSVVVSVSTREDLEFYVPMDDTKED